MKPEGRPTDHILATLEGSNVSVLILPPDSPARNSDAKVAGTQPVLELRTQTVLNPALQLQEPTFNLGDSF